MGVALKKNISEYDYVERLRELPTLPSIAFELNRLVQNPHSSTEKVTQILKKDPVLTSKILKLANSPYYSIPSGVESLERALQFLGFSTLSQIILAVSVFSMFRSSRIESMSLQDFWNHSFAVALICEKSLKINDPEKSNLGFTVGLLHNIGKLAFSELIPDEYQHILERSKSEALIDVENEELGTNHAILGGALAEYWGFPRVISDSIRDHHGKNSITLLSKTVYFSNLKATFVHIKGADPAFGIKNESLIDTHLFGNLENKEIEDIIEKIKNNLDGGLLQ